MRFKIRDNNASREYYTVDTSRDAVRIYSVYNNSFVCSYLKSDVALFVKDGLWIKLPDPKSDRIDRMVL